MDHHGFTWLSHIPFLPSDPALVHVNGSILVFLLITAFSLAAFFAIRGRIESYIVPSDKGGLVTIVDFLVQSVRGIAVDVLGKDAEKYFPFIGALFIFIWFSNLISLIPYSSGPTANVNTTLALGIASFVYYNYMGIREHGIKGYAAHFLMGLGPFGILIALLEVISHLIRPLSLGIRLFVNMHVDHNVVLSFQSLLAWILPIPLLFFGLIVSTIQAFVFATLTAVYVQMATEHEH